MPPTARMITKGPSSSPKGAKRAPALPFRRRPASTDILMPLAPGRLCPSAISARNARSSIQPRRWTISRYTHPPVPPPKLVQPSQKNARNSAGRVTSATARPLPSSTRTPKGSLTTLPDAVRRSEAIDYRGIAQREQPDGGNSADASKYGKDGPLDHERDQMAGRRGRDQRLSAAVPGCLR